jgi:hypothetical protein
MPLVKLAWVVAFPPSNHKGGSVYITSLLSICLTSPWDNIHIMFIISHKSMSNYSPTTTKVNVINNYLRYCASTFIPLLESSTKHSSFKYIVLQLIYRQHEYYLLSFNINLPFLNRSYSVLTIAFIAQLLASALPKNHFHYSHYHKPDMSHASTAYLCLGLLLIPILPKIPGIPSCRIFCRLVWRLLNHDSVHPHHSYRLIGGGLQPTIGLPPPKIESHCNHKRIMAIL